jgi:hypothetical protein
MTHLLAWLRACQRRHYWFGVLLLLFVAMRVLALLLFRPGGFFADNSDYEFYQLWGQMGPSGYTTFQNLWTAYPPLFPALMLPVFELSSRIPPWVESRLFFHLLFGGLLLLFEIGNLILIYRLGNRLSQDSASLSASAAHTKETSDARPPHPGRPAESSPPSTLPGLQPGLLPGLLPAVLYALLFAPLYTLLGWFEAMPLFFLLLGLDFLLLPRRWGWAASAVAAALGFLIKLTPILLVPIAIRWLGARLSLHAARTEWFNRRAPGNLLRPALYVLIFAAVTVIVGLLALGPGFDPQLALSSLRVNAIRPPWQSIWALLDGYYGYGLVPLDMRNLQGLAAGGQWQSRLPWGLISLAFLALYLWLYTRRYDWSRARTPIVFAAVSVIWLFLYSKGWSPQFVVWILAFIVLLTPTMHGIVLAVSLTAINFVESTLFLLVLPGEHWLLVATVLARTLLLLLLAVEWLGQVWPEAATAKRMQVWGARAAWVVVAAAIVVGLAGAPRAAQAYWDRRTAEHPCRDAVALLQAEASGTIITPDLTIWRDLYPWLHEQYTIHVLDPYDPNDRPADEVMGNRLAALAGGGEFWWLEAAAAAEQPGQGTAWSPVLHGFTAQPGVATFDAQVLGACRLVRVAALAPTPAATVATNGGPIVLQAITVGEVLPAAGSGTRVLPLVLYWKAATPVAASYTVFTQLLDSAGLLVAQQDNLPVRGLAPTDTWQPNTIIRDPYRLLLPQDTPAGDYVLHVGMYDADGRRPLTLADGTTADHLSLPVYVD